VIDQAASARIARIEPLLESARAIADPTSSRGRKARQRLVEATGLSPAGVDFALECCLESEPSVAELEALVRATAPAPKAHVLLSANVFVAAHRAIALGLASSAEVRVRASRREPEMAELLWEGAQSSFQLVPELRPEPGDQLWAYGSDDTLRSVARALRAGVTLHAHGAGFGLGVLAERASSAELERLLRKLAEDAALFDQRGCLSPRVLLVVGGEERTREVALELAAQLTAVEARLPRGRLAPQELAEITAYCDTASYAGELYEAGLGFVSRSASFLLPPVGRNLHVLATNNVLESLVGRADLVTSCAVHGDSTLRASIARGLPGARVCDFGQMQRPPFDGPVDRRKRQL
jgi:Acyl-CoA reductase (LuxC)